MRNKELLLFCFELVACVLTGQVAAQLVQVPDNPNLHIRLDLCTTAQKNAASSVESVFYTVTFNDSGCDTPAPVDGILAFRITLWSSDPESVAALTAKHVTNETLVSCTSWSLPFTPQSFEEEPPFQQVSRTLCNIQSFHPLIAVDDLGFVVSGETAYAVRVEPVYGFRLNSSTYPETTTTTFDVGPASPQIHYVEFPLEADACPLNDLVSSVKSVGLFQSMTTSATLTAQESDFPERRFFLVIVRADDEVCDREADTGANNGNTNATSGPSYLTKTVRVGVQGVPPVDDFLGEIFALPLGIIGVVIALVVPCAICFSPRFIIPSLCKRICGLDRNEETRCEDCCNKCLNITCWSCCSCQIQHVLGHKAPKVSDLQDQPIGAGSFGKRINKSKSSSAAFGTTFLFYFLPAFQMMLAITNSVIETDDENVCYYNFRCAFVWKSLNSVNSLSTSLLSAGLGMAFIAIVWIRNRKAKRWTKIQQKKAEDTQGVATQPERKYDLAQQRPMESPASPAGDIELQQVGGKNGDLKQAEEGESKGTTRVASKNVGTPQDPGIFYAMGFALVVEGVVNAIFHLCPTGTNFQYDGSFMYIIGTLVLYQSLSNRRSETKTAQFISLAFIFFIIALQLIAVYLDEKSPEAVRTVLFVVILLLLCILVFLFYHHNTLAEVFPEQMEAVERELKGAEGKWRELGRTLEIPEKTLDEIERTADSEDRLHQVLEEWVKKNGEEGTRATWKSLKDSLKVVGNDSIAQDLELQHLVTLWKRVVRAVRQCKIADWSLFVRLMVAVFINIALVVILAPLGILHGYPDIALSIEIFFLANIVYFLLTYILLKIVHNEHTCRIFQGVLVYFILAVTALVAGTVLSWNKLFNPQASPAASRALNEDCVLLNFYDIHDISHMCYALGCFFLFTFLLTVDDGEFDEEQDKLSSF